MVMNPRDLAQNMSATNMLYMDDPYLKSSSCNVLRVEQDDRKTAYVLVDQSIFHPKSGGQPSDKGRILGEVFIFEVTKVMLMEGTIVHFGKVVRSEPQTGSARLEIDWDFRYRCMRKHTAAHLLDNCFSVILKERMETTDSWVGDDSYVGYRGSCPAIEQLRALEEMANKLIAEGAEVTSQTTERKELLSSLDASSIVRLPKNVRLRIVRIGGFQGIPCGGTHVKNLREIGQFRLKSPQILNEGFRFNFDIVP